VRLATRVAEIHLSAKRVERIELQNGESLQADAYVLATNHHAVQKWIPDTVARNDSRFANLDRFDSVPILGVHLWFDRPILRESHAALMRRAAAVGLSKDEQGKALHGVISSAPRVGRSIQGRNADIVRTQIRNTFSEAADAKLIRGVVVIEKRATFSPTPGIDRIRPTQAPPPVEFRISFSPAITRKPAGLRRWKERFGADISRRTRSQRVLSGPKAPLVSGR